jgi:hypothetical protein
MAIFGVVDQIGLTPEHCIAVALAADGTFNCGCGISLGHERLSPLPSGYVLGEAGLRDFSRQPPDVAGGDNSQACTGFGFEVRLARRFTSEKARILHADFGFILALAPRNRQIFDSMRRSAKLSSDRLLTCKSFNPDDHSPSSAPEALP